MQWYWSEIKMSLNGQINWNQTDKSLKKTAFCAKVFSFDWKPYCHWECLANLKLIFFTKWDTQNCYIKTNQYPILCSSMVCFPYLRSIEKIVHNLPAHSWIDIICRHSHLTDTGLVDKFGQGIIYRFTVDSRYIAANLSRYCMKRHNDDVSMLAARWPNKRHPIPRSDRWAVGCLFLVHWWKKERDIKSVLYRLWISTNETRLTIAQNCCMNLKGVSYIIKPSVVLCYFGFTTLRVRSN